MTRLGHGALSPKRAPVELGEIVGRVRDLARTMAGHEMVVAIPRDLPMLDVDPVLIGQALTNILENADMDGKAVISTIRGWSRVPILVLSVRDAEAEKIAALDAGADDYVTKPFATGELLARLRALLRNRLDRSVEPAGQAIGALSVNFASRTVRVDGHEVKLTRKEFDVLALLARCPGRLVAHRQFLETVRDRPMQATPIICASPLATSATSWETMPRTRASSSPSRAWVIVWPRRDGCGSCRPSALNESGTGFRIFVEDLVRQVMRPCHSLAEIGHLRTSGSVGSLSLACFPVSRLACSTTLKVVEHRVCST